MPDQSENRWSVLNSRQLDEYAWKAICEWPAEDDSCLCLDGLNYADLTRWFLWDKVSRAVLCAADPQMFERGYHSFLAAPKPSPGETKQRNGVIGTFRERVSSLVQSSKKADAQAWLTKPFNLSRDQRLLYVPWLSERMQNPVVRIAASRSCRLLSKSSNALLLNIDYFNVPVDASPERSLAEDLHGRITVGLRNFHISLTDADSALLLEQIAELTQTVAVVDQELEMLEPDAILVHGDNHPPHQVYVAVARKKGIPAVMIQHGLDCEHHCLDEAYASDIAVWGPERLGRYRNKSEFQPRISVTGNPAYDHLRFPMKVNQNGAYWLWLTRPHSPEKCYAPSRLPDEGARILRALLHALTEQPDERLIIKPHSYDYCEYYRREIERSGMQDRVRVTDDNIHRLIPDSTIVITEDSTAGMEAMFWGKPLVHAHFAESVPTVPFVPYGAALPGFCPDELVASLIKVKQLTQAETREICEAQRAFLSGFAGPCDGRSGDRVVGLVHDIINRRGPCGIVGVRV